MRQPRAFGLLATALGCLGMLLPPPVVAAGPVPERKVASRSADTPDPAGLVDVALLSGGVLHGQVVDSQGAPLASETIVLLEGRREFTRRVSDASGKFVVSGLRGGVYEVRIRGEGHLFRLWSANTAPASARSAMLLVASGDVVRGQRPIGELLTSNVFVVSAVVAVVAAAVAIPIAVTNSKSDRGPHS